MGKGKSFLTGLLAGAAAVFFSKKENRDMVKNKANEIKDKVSDEAETLKRKVQAATDAAKKKE